MIWLCKELIPQACIVEAKKRWEAMDRISLWEYKNLAVRDLYRFDDVHSIERDYERYLKGEAVQVDVPDKIEEILKEVINEANNMIKF